MTSLDNIGSKHHLVHTRMSANSPDAHVVRRRSGRDRQNRSRHLRGALLAFVVLSWIRIVETLRSLSALTGRMNTLSRQLIPESAI
jgi:hypothetical protein